MTGKNVLTQLKLMTFSMRRNSFEVYLGLSSRNGVLCRQLQLPRPLVSVVYVRVRPKPIKRTALFISWFQVCWVS